MPNLFVGNFDFEHELVGGRQQSSAVKVILRDASTCWLGIADKNDLICVGTNTVAPRLRSRGPANRVAGPQRTARFITREEVEALPYPGQFELQPWGWSQSMVNWGRKVGFTVEHPALDVVRRVNSREFSFDLEQRLGTALPQSRQVHNDRDANNAICTVVAEFGRWVAKANWSMSARERILGDSPTLSEPQSRWLLKRLKTNAPLFIEPWVERIEELSFQWQIPKSNKPNFLSATKLLCDATGGYVGNRLLREIPDCWREAFRIAESAALQVAETGYFGPLGIDAMCYRAPDGAACLRPIQDINARYTMGRMAVEMKRFVTEDYASWLHVRADRNGAESVADVISSITETIPSDVQIIPFTASHTDSKTPVLLVSASEDSLLAAEAVALSK